MTRRNPRDTAPALLLLVTALGLAACGPPAKRGQTSASATAAAAGARPEFEVRGRLSLSGRSDHSGVQVYVPGSSLVAMTDSLGRYTITGLRPGVHEILAQHSGYLRQKIARVEFDEYSDTAPFYLPDASLLVDPAAGGAVAAFGSVTGIVRVHPDSMAEGETDLSRAVVEFKDTAMRTVADTNGRFNLWNVTPGEYRLVVRLDGFPAHESPVRVLAGSKPTTLDIELSLDDSAGGPREITGQIEIYRLDGGLTTDYGGVRVELVELPGRAAPVGADGTFRFGRLAGKVYHIQASADGFAPSEPVEIDLTDVPSMDVTLTIAQLPPPPETPGVIRGVAIRDSDSVSDMSGITVAVAGTSTVALTNREGGYVLNGIPPGTYDLLFQTQGFESVTLTGVEVPPATEITVQTVFLQPVIERPRVVMTDPPEGARDVLVGPELRIMVRFSKPMDPASLARNVRLTPDLEYELLAGRGNRFTDSDSMMIVVNGRSRSRPLEYGAKIEVVIAASASDIEGITMETPFRLRFEMGRAAIVDTTPADGEKNADLSPFTPVQIRFNAPVDSRSLTARDVRIRPSSVGIPTLNFLQDGITGWTTVQVSAQWTPDTQYEITLSKRIKTATGQTIDNTPYSFKFRTPEFADFGANYRIPVVRP